MSPRLALPALAALLLAACQVPVKPAAVDPPEPVAVVKVAPPTRSGPPSVAPCSPFERFGSNGPQPFTGGTAGVREETGVVPGGVTGGGAAPTAMRRSSPAAIDT